MKVRVNDFGESVETRLNSKFFAVTAILVLALALLVLVPSEVEAKRVTAKKSGLNVGIDGAKTGAKPLATLKPPVVGVVGRNGLKGLSDFGCLNRISGLIDYRIDCVDGQSPHIVGDTRIVGGGWIELGGGANLVFESDYALDVQQGGKLTIDNGLMRLFQPLDQGYRINVYPGGALELSNAEISDAREFNVYADGARLHGVYYRDNEQGLIVSADDVVIGGQSKFYDNNAFGLKVSGGGAGASRIFIQDSEFKKVNGIQGVGILLDATQNVVVERNAIQYNDVGIELENSLSNVIRDNVIQYNVKAGVKQFIPYAESEGGGVVDGFASSPNALRGNSVFGNGDGVIVYVVGVDVDAAQAGLIRGNTRYGLVTIDEDENAGIENRVGSGNGLGKAAHLHSMRVGGINNGGRMPTNPVYVTFCKGDIQDCGAYTGSRNDAYYYEDYAHAHSTTRRAPPWQHYFTSDLVASEERSFQGNHGMWTPRFLVYQHTIENNGANLNACDGNPDRCVARAINVYEGADFGGTQCGIDSSPQFEYTWISMSMGNFGGGKNAAGKAGVENKITASASARKTGKHSAVKIAYSTPEFRGVNKPPG